MRRRIPIPMNRDAPSASLFIGAMNAMFPLAVKKDFLEDLFESELTIFTQVTGRGKNKQTEEINRHFVV